MTNGLVVLIAWCVFGLVVATLAWIVLRRTNDDPIAELREDHLSDGDRAIGR
jgi:hypothetical protein